MSVLPETIAAIATPPGRGGVGIVRISGPLTERVAHQLLGACPTPRLASYASFRDPSGAVIDRGIAIYFPAPGSFTGESVLELHAHGSPIILDMLLEATFRLGARPARPGEFTERAFLNGKIDLAQAESVADLINARSVAAARSAVRSLDGDFSRTVSALADATEGCRIYVEAAIDFPTDEIDFLSDPDIEARIEELIEQLSSLLGTASDGALLNEGVTVVIAGRPNAGKSSLLNALAARESAIVSPIEGTTRDLLREQIAIDGLPLHILDTAGLRESEDFVEREGISRAWSAIDRADLVLFLVDDSVGVTEEDERLLGQLPERCPLLLVRNKIDISEAAPMAERGARGTEIRISAKSGLGLELLRDHMKQAVGYTAGEGTFMARRRHLEALTLAKEHLSTARNHLCSNIAGELVAEELRLAHLALQQITGRSSPEALLEKIFAGFCIGK